MSPGSGGKAGFTLQDPALTGVRFTNQLGGDLALTNAVAHNGSGVAIGDIDGDGWQDIYLCNLQGRNQLFRNLGGWRFTPMDLGEAACAGQLSTAAVFADVDGDGDLDLLVNGIGAGTRLFLNNGKGKWTEAKDSGLSRTASAMSMALADIDGDGDLDLYCAHYIDVLYLADPTTQLTMGQQNGRMSVAKVNGQPADRPPWKDRFEVQADGSVRELGEADGFYRNDGHGHFSAIQDVPGTFRDEQGDPVRPFRELGLGVMFRDVDGDGAPDLYVCNDNGAPDRFWINDGKGSFRAAPASALRHGSHSSMGIDFADVDRDGRDDFIVLDMLARDRAKRLTHPGKPEPGTEIRERPGTRPLVGRNTLFFGRKDGTYAEAALMAGVAATDWAWCPVFLDVDLDGYEDLLVTNGFEQDVLDQDSVDQIGRRKWTPQQMKRYRQIHPRWDHENLAFRNRGDGTFEPKGTDWGFALRGVSNGMAVGDLDNDGDLDGVVNNLNAPASLHRNDATAPRVAVRLKGTSRDTQGIGARITLRGGPVVQSQEMISGGRYLSGDAAMRVFAAGTGAARPMSLEIGWRDGTTSLVTNVLADRVYEIDQAATAKTRKAKEPPVAAAFVDISARSVHSHVEDAFDDWAQQPLLPHRLSRGGPGLAWLDLDGDGWEDVIVTGAKGGKLAVLSNQAGKGFLVREGADLAGADQTAAIAWADGKGHRDFLLGLSSQELPEPQESRIIRFNQTVGPRVVAVGRSSIGTIAMADIDGDGDLDVFVAGRSVPGRYPEPASSTILRNEDGELVPDATASAPFRGVGLVTGAAFGDLDGDDSPDLVLALEWGPLRVFLDRGGRFEDATAAMGLAEHTGLWGCVALGDFDGDGRLDIVAGNRGRNTVLELDPPGRSALFFGEWNGDGIVQMMEARQIGDVWFPIRDRSWLERGISDLPQRFATHAAFSTATVPEILGIRSAAARRLEAAGLESVIFLNRGDRFVRLPLPREAQRAPATSVAVGDLDGDGIEDVFLGQNSSGDASNLTRDDAGLGLWLRGKGDGTFTAIDASASGIRVEGEARGAILADFDHDGRVDLVVAQNDGPTKIFQNRLAQPGLRVALDGAAKNPAGIGARLRRRSADGKAGPVRTVQDSTAQALGGIDRASALEVRWPDGRQKVVPLEPGRREVRVAY